MSLIAKDALNGYLNLCDYQKKTTETYLSGRVVLLISLMKDQVSNLNPCDIPTSYVGKDCLEQQLDNILDLKAKLVFGSPEVILNSSIQTYVSSSRFKQALIFLRPPNTTSFPLKLLLMISFPQSKQNGFGWS